MKTIAEEIYRRAKRTGGAGRTKLTWIHVVLCFLFYTLGIFPVSAEMASEDIGSATPSNSIGSVRANQPPQFTLAPSPIVEEDGGLQWFENFVTSFSVGPAEEREQSYSFFVTHDHPELFTVPPYITPQGTLTFTPAPDQFGKAAVTLSMQDNGGTDNNGVDFTKQSFTITVQPINDAPRIGTLEIIAGKEGETTALRAPFTDIDSSGPFSASIFWGDGTLSPGKILANSPMVVMATHTYIETGDYQLNIRVRDKSEGIGQASAEVSINNLVQTVNAGEDIVADIGFTVQFEGQFKAHNPFDTHTIHWNFGDGSTAESTLTPSHNYGPGTQGRFVVTLTVTDEEGGSIKDELIVDIRAINDAPLLSTIEDQITLEDQPIDSIYFQATDPEGDELRVVAFSSDETKVPHENISLIPLDELEHYQLRIIPAPDRIGSVTIQLVADDGILQATREFRLFLSSVNDVPGFDLGLDLLIYEDSGPMFIERFAYNIWNDSWGANQSRLIFTLTCDRPHLFQQPPAMDEKGLLSFVPAPNAHGQAHVTVRLESLVEGREPVLSYPKTFIITLLPMPDPPIAYNDFVSFSEDHAAILNVLANDSDADDESLTVQNYTQPSFGVVTTKDKGAELEYRPRSNFSGLDSFTYTLEDESGDTAMATVYLTVTPLNDFPFSINDQIETHLNTAVVVPVLDNDVDPDRDDLAVFTVGKPEHGKARREENGQILYEPDEGYIGTDEFTYTVVDHHGGMDRAVVTVIVQGEKPTVQSVMP